MMGLIINLRFGILGGVVFDQNNCEKSQSIQANYQKTSYFWDETNSK